MSLTTDVIFVRALKADTELMALLPSGDVHNTSIALPDEDLDNAPLPYVIVSFNGMQNDMGTKDGYEGDTDTVTIGVEVAAKTREQLGMLTERIRTQVRTYFEELDDEDTYSWLVPYDYNFSAGPVMFDQLKPCYWQELTWQCDTNAFLDNE